MDPAPGEEKQCFCDADQTVGGGDIAFYRRWFAADAKERETIKGEQALLMDEWEAEQDAADAEARAAAAIEAEKIKN
jgi:hypothetical protein